MSIKKSNKILEKLIWVESKIFNPLIKKILDSKLHWPLSTRLMCISYKGHKSGEKYTTPVYYHPNRNRLFVITMKQEASWWKNFRKTHPVKIKYKGKTYKTTGDAVIDPETISKYLKKLIKKSWHWKILLKIYGVPINPTEKQIREKSKRLVLVKFKKP
ncbi:hypothetical protein [Methanonatronarchaeum sp. AMET-Sl]|uniref:hypothetical protein n=1 Tax=Methanonatronarchaeum sp. AMET-Sl TaxID=3037654 RepID=UPI00244E238A|nr:hypothetical protein [Methanonatronarchaeum sp. AMET-Sl]WGI17820.1 hypothetical protein QEN48_02100 [Methanonatronarchaeum sp. AMET-Sl]